MFIKTATHQRAPHNDLLGLRESYFVPLKHIRQERGERENYTPSVFPFLTFSFSVCPSLGLSLCLSVSLSLFFVTQLRLAFCSQLRENLCNVCTNKTCLFYDSIGLLANSVVWIVCCWDLTEEDPGVVQNHCENVAT